MNETMEQIEARILDERGITKIDDRSYGVPASDNLHQYTVRFVGRTDDGFGRLWECDCAAGQHGRDCRHLKTVVAANNAICGETGQD